MRLPTTLQCPICEAALPVKESFVSEEFFGVRADPCACGAFPEGTEAFWSRGSKPREIAETMREFILETAVAR